MIKIIDSGGMKRGRGWHRSDVSGSFDEGKRYVVLGPCQALRAACDTGECDRGSSHRKMARSEHIEPLSATHGPA